MAIQGMIKCTAYKMQGPEAEMKKVAPILEQYYPDHKLTIASYDDLLKIPVFGWKNERDAHILGKKGGPVVLE